MNYLFDPANFYPAVDVREFSGTDAAALLARYFGVAS